MLGCVVVACPGQLPQARPAARLLCCHFHGVAMSSSKAHSKLVVLNRCLLLLQVTEMQQRSKALELSAALRQQTGQLQESEQHRHDLQQQVGNMPSEQQ